MKKLVIAVVLATTMGSASAFWGNNNWNNDNGIFGFNPYSFMNPKWFIQEADNFMDEFDNDYRYNRHGYNGRSYHSFPVSNDTSYVPWNSYGAKNKDYYSNYMKGYSKYYK